MKRFIIPFFTFAFAFALLSASAVTATKEYVDRQDAANLQAAKDYTDQKVAESENTLQDALDAKADKADISATNPTFSNAVLAVGLNIDTNSVAVLNEIAETFGGFPLEGTATTVGGLLAALAAAVAWLKKNKVQTLKLEDGSVETSADGGVAKLDDFFTDSNSLLTETIESKVNSMFDNGDTTSYPRPTEG